jgi:hypothetical protein
MIAIRKMVAQERSYKDIMEATNLPERTFFRYLSQTFKHSQELLQQQNKETMALELSVLKKRLTNAYRRLAAMASDESVSPRDRIGAEKAGCEVAIAIVKLQFEGPIILKDVCAQISYR